MGEEWRGAAGTEEGDAGDLDAMTAGRSRGVGLQGRGAELEKGSALEEADGVGEDEQPEQQGRSALLSSAMAGAGGWGSLASC